MESAFSVSIIERDHLIAEKHLFLMQDAVKTRLPPGERYRTWVKYLFTENEKFNNSVTHLIGMTSAEVITKKKIVDEIESLISVGCEHELKCKN